MYLSASCSPSTNSLSFLYPHFPRPLFHKGGGKKKAFSYLHATLLQSEWASCGYEYKMSCSFNMLPSMRLFPNSPIPLEDWKWTLQLQMARKHSLQAAGGGPATPWKFPSHLSQFDGSRSWVVCVCMWVEQAAGNTGLKGLSALMSQGWEEAI